MENVIQAATFAPTPVSAKGAPAEAPVDADGAPLPGAFFAMLCNQVKNLKCAPTVDVLAADPNAAAADPSLPAADPSLTTDPTTIDLQLLVGLPPSLPATAAAAAPDAVAGALTPDAGAAADVAAASAAASTAAAASVVAAALAVPAPAVPVASAAPAIAAATVTTVAATVAPTVTAASGPTQIVATKLPQAPADAKSPAVATADGAPDSARTSGTREAPETRAPQTREPIHTDTAAGQSARGELLRTSERTLSDGVSGRDSNAQTVPQLAFTQAFGNAQAASAAAPAAQLQIDTQVGAAGWGNELGQRVLWMANEKQQIAELHVNPPDLGPLNIKLTMDGGTTTAVFTSPHSSVRDAVESALPRLREVLADSGIMLGNASVTADSPRDGSAFAQPQARTPVPTQNESAREAAMRLTPGTGGTVRGRGLVDLFA